MYAWNVTRVTNSVVAESIWSNSDVSDARLGIQLVNSSLVVKNCTIDGGDGVQLSGSTPMSLTLDHTSISTRYSEYGIRADLDTLDMSVTNSHLSSYYAAVYVRCSKRLNVRIVNSTMRSRTSAVTVMDVGGSAIQATIIAESSSFIGQVSIDAFTYYLQQLVCFLKLFIYSLNTVLCGSSGPS